MARTAAARGFFLLTALTVFLGMIIQLWVSAHLTGTQFTTVGARIFNVFCYFTVQSNLIVGVTCLLLALRLNRASTVFRVFRLAGLIGITVTFVVFHVALAHLQDLKGSAAAADMILHTIDPILALVGWLGFGPRAHVSARIALLSVLFPVAWMCLALIRGPLVDFYAYPFADPRSLGYPRVLVNGVLVGLLFIGSALVALAVDRLIRHFTARQRRRGEPRPVG